MKNLFLILSTIIFVNGHLHGEWWTVGNVTDASGNGGEIFALLEDTITYNLFIGGAFAKAGGMNCNNFVMWNTTSFVPTVAIDGTVYSLVFGATNSEIYIGGNFDFSGFRNVVKYNVNSKLLTALGGGASNYPATSLSYVRALAFNTQSGILYAGGHWNTSALGSSISSWNGNQWSPLLQGVNGNVYALKIWNGALYLGGSFTQAGGVAASNVAKWSGTAFSNLLGGVDGDVTSFDIYRISDESVPQKLFFAGAFSHANGEETISTVSWDGSAYVDYSTEDSGMGQLNTLAIDFWTGGIYIGGSAGRLFVYGDGDGWDPAVNYVFGSRVSAIFYDHRGAYNETNIYIAGSFSQGGFEPNTQNIVRLSPHSKYTRGPTPAIMVPTTRNSAQTTSDQTSPLAGGFIALIVVLIALCLLFICVALILNFAPRLLGSRSNA